MTDIINTISTSDNYIKGNFIKVKAMEHPIVKTHLFEVIEKPQACSILLLNKDKTEVFMIKQWGVGKNGYTWEFPAGLVDAKENPRETILREVQASGLRTQCL